MPKGQERRNTNRMIQDNYVQNQREHVEDRTRNNNWTDEYHNRESELYDQLHGGFTGMAGGLDAETQERFRRLAAGGYGGGGGGGAGLEGLYSSALGGGTINVDRLRSAVPTLTRLMETGGYDAAEKEAIMKDIGGLRNIGHHQYAGISDADLNNWRGNGVFKEFSDTGGLSDRERMMLRSRGTATIPSVYGSMQRDVDRGIMRGNNSGANRSAMMSRLSRNAARDMQSAALDTELGITDRVNQGRRWGAEGLSNAEAGIQNLVLPSKMGSLNSAIENSRGIQEFIAAMQLESGMGLTEVESMVENMLMDERRWGASNLEASAARGAAASAGRNRDMLDMERYLLEYGDERMLAGLGGLGGLYNTNTGNVQSGLDRSINERGLTYNQGGDAVNQRIVNNPQFDWGGFLGNVLGAGAGVATGIWGGRTRQPRNTTMPTRP